MAEYAASARSTNCEIKCACGETATLNATCTSIVANSTCAADFAAAGTDGPEVREPQAGHTYTHTLSRHLLTSC
jgi:hypothetical protein